MAQVIIERLNGERVKASYVRHLRTLTGGSGRSNEDVDLYRLADGTEIECICKDDARATPRECDPQADAYPGHRVGA